MTKLFPGVKSGTKEYRRLYSKRHRALDPRGTCIAAELGRRKKGIPPLKHLEDFTDEELNIRRKQNKLAAIKYRKTNPNKDLLRRAKGRAKKKGIEFNIELSDINIPELCPVFGYKLVLHDGTLGHDSMSLDRIENTKGYIKGNIIVVSHRANTLKNDATLDELKRIVEFYSGIA